MEPIYTFAQWKIKEGQLQTVLGLLPELVEKTIQEEGNLLYKVYQSNADTNTLILWESYKDSASVEAHRDSAHFKEIVVEQIVPLLEKREVVLTSELVFL